VSGQIIGRAATSLSGDTRWATNAGTVSAGTRGEAATAYVLNQMAGSTEITVMHDVSVPIPGMSINIDHVVIASNRVMLIDSKSWKPGFLWTFGGKTRRGFQPFAACDKKSVQMAQEAFTAYLSMYDVHLTVPVVVVWPSRREGKVSLWAATFPSARLVHGAALERVVRRAVPVTKQADPRIVQRIRSLVA